MFECDIEHCRSVAVLCMLYKVRCNPMHPRYGALHSQYVPVAVHAVLWSHSGTLMRFLAAEPHSSAGHLFSNQYLCGTILVTLIRWCGTGGFPVQGQSFFIGPAARCHFVFCFPLLSYHSVGSYCGVVMQMKKRVF